MKFTFINLTAVFLILMLLYACGGENSTNTDDSSITNLNQIGESNGENANSARDDIEELGKIIKLPFEPEEASYWEENVFKTEGANQNRQQTSKKIVAVLRFSKDNAAQLTNQIEKNRPPVDAEIDAENRFPAELVALSQLSGDETLKGKSYAANDFFQTPYIDGKITRIENSDYFVLELTAR